MTTQNMRKLRKQLAAIEKSIGKENEERNHFQKNSRWRTCMKRIIDQHFEVSTKQKVLRTKLENTLCQFLEAYCLNNLHLIIGLSGSRRSKESQDSLTLARRYRKFLLRQREAGHIDKLPKLDNPDVKRNVGRAMTREEIIKVLWKLNRPFRFIFYCMYKMGIRPREMAPMALGYDQVE